MSDLPTILPPNAQETERELEQLSGRLLGFGDPIAGLWDASLCPEHLLSYLAWAFSVEVWDVRVVQSHQLLIPRQLH